jgi:hypothetical protein
MTIGVCNEVGDSSLDCQSYLTFVIEVSGTLGLSIGPNITWNEITPGSIDEPITTGIVRKLAVARAWKWQRSWSSPYCIVIEGESAKDPWRE